MDQEIPGTDATSSTEICLETSDPAVIFENITFSDGTKIDLKPNDVVVLVGPNKSGKSVALRELQKQLETSHQGTVVTQVNYRCIGTTDELHAYLKRHTKKNSQQNRYDGYNISAPLDHVDAFWPKNNGIRNLARFFCLRLLTETRITDSNPAPAINTLEEAVSNPIQLLYSDDKLEKRINDYFQQAFGKDLVVFRLGGTKFPLLLGQNPSLQADENLTSASYCERLAESTTPLKEQGDGMRSFASVVLHLLAPVTPSILMLDEPEAFLHPPQAKLLGELIAKERPSRSQLFVATHSPDVINGLLNVAPDNLRILRIQREGDVNRVKKLDKQRAKEISADPLMRYSSVMSGVFHERVIICESDSDCMFYNSILDLPEVSGEQHPDVLFVHANGKHRMAVLAKALKELDVPVDVVADIDILKNDDVLKDIIKSLGGDWDIVQPIAQMIRTAIKECRPQLNAAEITKAIKKCLKSVPSIGEFPKETASEITRIFRDSSPWEAVKRSGKTAIPNGEATKKFNDLQQLCNQVGLWIVPVGELEGFCKSIGGHGPRWVQEVISNRELSTDPDLQCAREFVCKIWDSRYPR